MTTRWIWGLLPALLLTGCASGLPPLSAVPDDTEPLVRKHIHRLYWDAQCRAQGCLELHRLARSGVDCSPAVPWLVPLLADDTYAWSPSFFIRVVGTPVWCEAADALEAIGPPAVPALEATARDSDDPEVRERIQRILDEIADLHREPDAAPASRPEQRHPAPPGCRAATNYHPPTTTAPARARHRSAGSR